MSYSDELRNPLWQKRRLQVFERAGWRCEWCGTTQSQLHAHHKVYLSRHKPWEYPDILLECLCDQCHERAHEHKRQFELCVASRPSAELSKLNRLFDKLAAAMTAPDRTTRIDLMNAVQDEFDVIDDFRRGPGGTDEPVHCICEALKSGMSAAKWSDETFYENGHVSDCPVGEVLNLRETSK